MAEQSPLYSELLSYRILDNKVHFIRLEQTSNETVETLMALMNQLLAQSTSATPMNFMIDSAKVTLPVAISIRQAFELEKRQPSYPPARIALLIPESMLRLMDTLLKPFRGKNQIRVFNACETEMAMAWLLVRKASTNLQLLLNLRQH